MLIPRVYLVAVLLSCLISPNVVAQQTLPRVGVLWPGGVSRYISAFNEGLRQRGYVDGTSVTVDVRATNGDFDRAPGLAQELVASTPDVIFAVPGPLAREVVRAVDKTGKRIPIVVYADDPVEEGLVARAAHPAGNVTGIGDVQEPEFVTKLLQVLKEVVPTVSRVLYFEDPTWGPGGSRARKSRAAMESGGRQLGITVITNEIRSPGGSVPDVVEG